MARAKGPMSEGTGPLTRRWLEEISQRILPSEEAKPPSLIDFVERTAYLTLEPWQRLLCERLEHMVLHQRGQRLLLHGPPQFGKSILTSQRLPAWAVGVNPLLRLRLACYNITHAERFGRVNRDLLQDPSFFNLFPNPDCRLPPVVAGDEWSTAARARARDAQPSFKALGLGSGYTGLGTDLLVIDDPYKDAVEARSEATNAMIWSWWTDVVVSRLNTATNVVVMFHRWWEGDFAGKLMEQGGWEIIRFPAICDGGSDDPTFVSGMRAVGEILSPRYPASYLDEVKEQQGTSFEALYQGVPYPAEGGMFKDLPEACVIEKLPSDVRVLSRVRHWDLAATEGGRRDATVGTLVARLSTGKYLIEDVVRGRWDPAARDEMILITATLDRKRGRVVQQLPQDPGQAGKSQAAAMVKLLAGFSVKTLVESGSKEVRADPLASQWNAGNVLLLRALWNTFYRAEFHAFPYGKTDDCVDATANGFNALAEKRGGLPYAWRKGSPQIEQIMHPQQQPAAPVLPDWTPGSRREDVQIAAKPSSPLS